MFKKLHILITLCLIFSTNAFAQSTVPNLSANSSPASGDLLYTVDVSDTSDSASGTGKKTTFAQTESVLESLIDLQDLQGSVTDAQVPDTITASNYLPLTGGTLSGDVNVPAEAYDATSWNGSTEAPTKDALRDKIETIVAGSGSVSDTVYGSGWNGDTTNAPSKNAVYDKVETVVSSIPTISDTAYGSGWNGDTGAASKNAIYDKIETIGGGTGAQGILDVSTINATGLNGANMNMGTANGLATFNGNQYVCFWDSDQKLVVGKRSLPNGVWANTKYTSITSTNTTDNHLGCSLGVDPNGFVHIAYDMHGNSLKYRKSSSAENITAFGSAISMLGTNESQVSYPTFFNDNSGNLYFMFRDGGSGDGDSFMYKYTHGTTTWAAAPGTSTAGKFINGKGTSVNAYISVPYFDANNKGHMWFAWRDDTGGETLHDVNYVRYDATGGDFEKADGSAQTIPITTSNEETIDTVGTNAGFIDAQSQYGVAADASGNIIVSFVKNDASGNYSQVFFRKWNGSTWGSAVQLTQDANPPRAAGATIAGTFSIQAPSVFVDSSDNFYIVYNSLVGAPGLRAFKSTDAGATWVSYNLYSNFMGNFRPNVDRTAYQSSKELYFLFQNLNDLNITQTLSPIYLLHWKLSDLVNSDPVYDFSAAQVPDLTLRTSGGDIRLTTYNTNNDIQFYTGGDSSNASTFRGGVSSTGAWTTNGNQLTVGGNLILSNNTSGRILVADGTKFAPVAMSGDCTIASSGAITCSASGSPAYSQLTNPTANTALTFGSFTNAWTSSLATTSDFFTVTGGQVNLASSSLKMPQGSSCSGFTAEGRTCWDTDDDHLYIGDGSSAKQIDGGSAGYSTVQDEASNLTQRTTINFTGSGVACVDNSGNSRTDCTINGGGGSDNFSLTLRPEEAKLPSSNPMSINAGGNRWKGLFNADTIQSATWEGVLKPFTGTLKALVFYSMASATSGTVEFDVSLDCITPGDSADIDTESFGTADVLTGTVPGTAGFMTSLADTSLNGDSCADGDMIVVKVTRDATDGTNDTATGDAELRKVLIYAE